MIIDKRDEISTKMKKRQFRRQDPLWGLANRFSSILKTTFHMKHPAYITHAIRGSSEVRNQKNCFICLKGYPVKMLDDVDTVELD